MFRHNDRTRFGIRILGFSMGFLLTIVPANSLVANVSGDQGGRSASQQGNQNQKHRDDESRTDDSPLEYDPGDAEHESDDPVRLPRRAPTTRIPRGLTGAVLSGASTGFVLAAFEFVRGMSASEAPNFFEYVTPVGNDPEAYTDVPQTTGVFTLGVSLGAPIGTVIMGSERTSFGRFGGAYVGSLSGLAFSYTVGALVSVDRSTSASTVAVLQSLPPVAGSVIGQELSISLTTPNTNRTALRMRPYAAPGREGAVTVGMQGTF